VGATRGELLLGLPLAAFAGLLVGALGTFKHQFGVSPTTGTGLPVGLVLSLLMVAAVLVALRVAFGTRWFAAAAAAGVLIAVLVLAQKLLPPRAALDVPVASAIVAFGLVILIAPASVPGLVPSM
jgi:hypothetical protein